VLVRLWLAWPAMLLALSLACTGAGMPSGGGAPGEASDAARRPLTLTDATGHEVSVTSTERIVSLSADVTEIVFALGLRDRLVGVADASSAYPPQAQNLPKVSTGHTLSAEGILGLNPTVVVGHETAGPPTVPEQVRMAGVPLVLAAAPTTLEAPALKLRLLGETLGVPERVRRWRPSTSATW
jgi:iron complex transport system substrate-binding protein